MSLCVLGEESPFPYVTVDGRGRIEGEGAVELMLRVGEVMPGQPRPAAMRSGRRGSSGRAPGDAGVVLRDGAAGAAAGGVMQPRV